MSYDWFGSPSSFTISGDHSSHKSCPGSGAGGASCDPHAYWHRSCLSSCAPLYPKSCAVGTDGRKDLSSCLLLYAHSMVPCWGAVDVLRCWTAWRRSWCMVEDTLLCVRMLLLWCAWFLATVNSMWTPATSCRRMATPAHSPTHDQLQAPIPRAGQDSLHNWYGCHAVCDMFHSRRVLSPRCHHPVSAAILARTSLHHQATTITCPSEFCRAARSTLPFPRRRWGVTGSLVRLLHSRVSGTPLTSPDPPKPSSTLLSNPFKPSSTTLPNPPQPSSTTLLYPPKPPS